MKTWGVQALIQRGFKRVFKKMATHQRWYLDEGCHNHPNDALRDSSASKVRNNRIELSAHLFVKHVPNADLTSMRSSQEPEKHQQ